MNNVQFLDSASLSGSRVKEGRRAIRGGLTARLATTPLIMKEAQALRYQSYLSYGHIDEAEDELFSDHYDELPTSKTIVIYKNGTPAASIRVSLFAPDSGIPHADDVPATEIFREEVMALLRGLGRGGRSPRAADITRLVRHPDFAHDNELVFALYRMSGYLYMHYDADILLATVRENHTRFYKRMSFQIIAEPRDYPRTKFRTGLMACLRSHYEQFILTAPFLQGLSKESPIFPSFINGELVPVFPQSPYVPAEQAQPASQISAQGIAS